MHYDDYNRCDTESYCILHRVFCITKERSEKSTTAAFIGVTAGDSRVLEYF